MTTPEGEVKKEIAALLIQYKIYSAKMAGGFPDDALGWFYMHVPMGRGVRGIPDYLGHYKGIFWAIEAKAEGKEPTGFQALQIAAIKQSGGFVCVVDSPESLKKFEEWLEGV